MSDKKLLSVLNALAHQSVFFGPQGFNNVTSQAQLHKAQLGFGISELGQETAQQGTTIEAGQWQASWQVVGRDTELGDPYFVDTQHGDLPVYTGFLADKGWEVEQVATTLPSYVRCMQLLLTHGGQTQAHFFPDHSSITDEATLAQLEQELIELSGCQHFWQLFMQCYRDWLVED